MTFDPNDLSGFQTEKKAIIQSKNDKVEDSLLKSLFVTNPEAQDEFEQEKEMEVEDQVGS